MKFYAVRTGRTPGIYITWDECRKQVYQFPGAKYKAFPTRQEAEAFINQPQIAQPSRTISHSKAKGIEIWVDGSCQTGPTGTLYLGWGLLVKRNGEEIHRANC